MKVEAVDLTTAAFMRDPEKAFSILSQTNKDCPQNPSKVEVYPTPPGILMFKEPKAHVTAKRLNSWQEIYGVDVERVHLPWMYNWREIAHQSLFGDWYHSQQDRLVNTALALAMGPATNKHGLKIAKELNVGVNVHPNVIAGYAKEEKLSELKQNARFVLAENSIEFNSLYQKNRKILGDPVETIKNNVVMRRLDGFLFAIDHMFGLKPETDVISLNKAVDQILAVAHNKFVRQYTKAMHLSLPGHGIINVGDPHMEKVLEGLAQTNFYNPVRVALDFSPTTFDKMTESEQIDYIKRVRDWIFDITEKNN